jgi:hypothetical protein
MTLTPDMALTPAMTKTLVKIRRDGYAHAWYYHLATVKALYKRGLITVYKGPGGAGPFVRACKTDEKPQNGHLLCSYDPELRP